MSFRRLCLTEVKVPNGHGSVAWQHLLRQQEEFMAEEPRTEGAALPVERIPFMQRVLDNPFLLLFVGVVVPTVIYILWGVMEISQIPLAK
jgi:hypothetical protein